MAYTYTVPIPYTSGGTNTSIAPPTPPTVPDIPSFSSQFLPLFSGLFSAIQNFTNNPLSAPNPQMQGYLDTLNSAEQGAVNLQGQENRDKLASQLYSQFGQQSPTGTSPTTGLADQIGAKFEYGQDQLNRQVAADAAQRSIDLAKFASTQGLAGLGLQGSTLASAGGLESQNYANMVNALLGQGNLANSIFGNQTQLYGLQSGNALQFMNMLLGLLPNMFGGGSGSGGSSPSYLGGPVSSGGGVSGGGVNSPAPPGTPYFGTNMQPPNYALQSYNNQQNSYLQQQQFQSFMNMLMSLLQNVLG